MKFHCESCNTRYSISDDRVRGKILKIRCKNCSAAITVREAAVAVPKPQSSRSNLEGAFALALGPSGASRASEPLPVAPQTLASQWYLAVDGEQVGPYDLATARQWVMNNSDSGTEIYCWSEGFDDWLGIGKVSHFRGLTARRDDRSRPAIEGRATIDIPWPALDDPDTSRDAPPKPLFAATLASLEAEVGASSATIRDVAANGLPPLPKAELPVPDFGAGTPRSSLFDSVSREADQSLEFDIGEASRVVKMPQLAQFSQIGLAAGPAAAAAGVTRKDESGVASAAVLASVSRKRGLMAPLIASIAVLLALVSVLVFLTVGDDDDATNRVARGSVGGGGNLGYTFRDPRRLIIAAEQKTELKQGGNVRRNPRLATAPTGLGASPPSSAYDEVAIGDGEQAGGPLDGNDLSKVYRNNQYLMKRCYERALKKDPFLKVPKIWVSIQVGKSGSVSQVNVPGLAGSELGDCLTKIIARWKFRKTTEVFDGKFPVVFN